LFGEGRAITDRGGVTVILVIQHSMSVEVDDRGLTDQISQLGQSVHILGASRVVSDGLPNLISNAFHIIKKLQ
jgi:hypothetical protein